MKEIKQKLQVTCSTCGSVSTTECEYVIKRGWDTVKQCLHCNPRLARQLDIALRVADLPAAKLRDMIIPSWRKTVA